MADITKLSRLLTGVQRGVSLANNEILVNNIKIKAGSGNDAFYATFSGALSAVRTIALPDTNLDLANIAALVALSGVAANSTVLGAFTGGVLTASETIKSALQKVSDAAEAGGTSEFIDTDFRINDNGDGTKQLAFEVSAITTATTRTISVPDTDVDLADIASNSEAITDLQTLSGVAANSEDLGTFTGDIIPDTSDIKEALQSLETAIENLPDPMEYKGLWAASTNTPTLADGIGNNGDVYHVTDAGTVDFGAGNITFAAGDKVVYNGATSVWEKWDQTDAVSSVNNQTGAVVLEADDIDLATGYTAGAGVVSDADTVQSALQKIDGNANAAQADATQALSDAATAQAAAEAAQDDVDALELVVAANAEKLQRIAALGEATITSGVKALRWAKAADVGFVAGRLYLADNDATSADNFHVAALYVAAGTEVITNSLTTVKAGKLVATGHGFTVGQPIFLGASGALTSTAPSADNLAVVKVGIAEDANTIDVAIQIMGVN